jgi:hypothetical protein
MLRFLRRLFHRHRVEHYTDHAAFTRGVCVCGVEGDLDTTGRFI